MRDEEMWQWWGHYGISALVFSIEHCLAGRKARTKYVEEPLSKKCVQEENEEKIQQQRDLFVAGLMAMQANFELNQETNKDSED